MSPLLTHVTRGTRFSELDAWRGSAVLGMIVYHAAYVCMAVFFGVLWHPAPVLRLFGWMVAFSFLLIFGIVAQLKWFRLTSVGLPFWQRYQQFARRGAVIGLAAGLVSLGTYIVMPQLFVRFGILHLLALSSFILPVFLKNTKTLLLSCVVVLVAWLCTAPISFVNSYWLLPLGLMPSTYRAIDHWPLVPFFIVPVLGAVVGKYLYPAGKRAKILDRLITQLPSAPHWLLFLGRHALAVYVLHAPVLWVVFWTMKQLSLR